MRVHLGHHFYGAGNLGDDFMLAGFLAAMSRLAPQAAFTCCVPFPLAPLARRFPRITWLPYDDGARDVAIAECDAWLGLGGSPFQSRLSRWFIDHLTAEATFCANHAKPMYYLGVGVQNAEELALDEVRAVCAQAVAIWTRDSLSAERLRAATTGPAIAAAADLAHLLFRQTPPPAAVPGRLNLVPNFDYEAWPGQTSALSAIASWPARERVWLAQESRELPGAERALYASLSSAEQARWRLVSPDEPGAPLDGVLARWPSGEWLITARYHAALAGAWAGSRVIVLATNEKLRAAARELPAALLSASASEAAVTTALAETPPCAAPHALADQAEAACAAFVRSAVAHRG